MFLFIYLFSFNFISLLFFKLNLCGRGELKITKKEAKVNLLSVMFLETKNNLSMPFVIDSINS